MYKLLKIIFVILIVVTVVEAGYYLYLLNSNNINNFISPLIGKNTKDNQLTTSEVVDNTQEDQGNIDAVSNIEQNFLNSSVLQSVRRFNNLNNQNVYAVLEQEGIVQKILYVQEGKISPYLTIADENGNRIITIIINPKIKFYKLNENNKIPITFEDVKLNDKIVIRFQSDLLDKNNNILEYFVL